jgi:FixJ family two-component response regulator
MSKNQPLIAIVDDDASVRRALRRLIRSLKMNAEIFTSGQEFLDLIESMPSFKADCVILDIQMAGLNGLATQENLVAKGIQLPVIFITAHDEVGARERALAAGAMAFLRKPFSDKLLIKILDKALGRTIGTVTLGEKGRKSKGGSNRQRINEKKIAHGTRAGFSSERGVRRCREQPRSSSLPPRSIGSSTTRCDERASRG